MPGPSFAQIVILSKVEKEEMEEALERRPPRDGLQGSTLTCRTGDALERSELIKVSAQHARWVDHGCNVMDVSSNFALEVDRGLQLKFAGIAAKAKGRRIEDLSHLSLICLPSTLPQCDHSAGRHDQPRGERRPDDPPHPAAAGHAQGAGFRGEGRAPGESVVWQENRDEDCGAVILMTVCM